jgi:hypothetical protein
MSSEQSEQTITPVTEQPIVEQPPTEIKQRKCKVYVKKGLDSRGRPAIEGKTTEYGLPADPEYYKKYYQQKLAIKVQCQECLMFVAKVNLKKHKQSSYHQRFCQTIQNNQIDV